MLNAARVHGSPMIVIDISAQGHVRRCQRQDAVPKVERVTKQVRVLTPLSQLEGASIDEMMQATD
jgi:hypothetical protein